MEQAATIQIGDEVRGALEARRPVVALESAVLTHGLPVPRNVEALESMERSVRAAGAVPAICIVERGTVWVGPSRDLIDRALADTRCEKASVRDLGRVAALGTTAGLTVSATLHLAEWVGIAVFATGGIGGVHRGDMGDVSTDLWQLAMSEVIVVCSGAKSVLDIPRTLEYLETVGVPVVGYETDRFPAFYLSDSGERVPRVDGPDEVCRIARSQWEMASAGSLVVGNPIPKEAAIAADDWSRWMGAAMQAAERDGVRGKDVTPYLLARVAEASRGETVDANLALLAANARVAAEIAVALAS